jgi:DnaK suppressor protein
MNEPLSPPLTPQQIASLRTEIEQGMRRLDQRLSDQLGGLPRAEHARELLQQDSDDPKHREQARELDAALSDRETQALGAMAAALRRIDGGDYGRCADCGGAIPFARLRAEPWALRCVACEGRREAG